MVGNTSNVLLFYCKWYFHIWFSFCVLPTVQIICENFWMTENSLICFIFSCSWYLPLGSKVGWFLIHTQVKPVPSVFFTCLLQPKYHFLMECFPSIFRPGQVFLYVHRKCHTSSTNHHHSFLSFRWWALCYVYLVPLFILCTKHSTLDIVSIQEIFVEWKKCCVS